MQQNIILGLRSDYKIMNLLTLKKGNKRYDLQINNIKYCIGNDFEEKYNFKVPAGAFGENLLVEGIDLKNLPIGTRLKVNDILLEITQIGKKCHLGCNIQKQTGECIMPNEGVFVIVLNGGEIKAQDTIFVEA